MGLYSLGPVRALHAVSSVGGTRGIRALRCVRAMLVATRRAMILILRQRCMCAQATPAAEAAEDLPKDFEPSMRMAVLTNRCLAPSCSLVVFSHWWCSLRRVRRRRGGGVSVPRFDRYRRATALRSLRRCAVVGQGRWEAAVVTGVDSSGYSVSLSAWHR